MTLLMITSTIRRIVIISKACHINKQRNSVLMYLLNMLYLMFVVFFTCESYGLLSDEELSKVPKYCDVEDISKCNKEHHIFCRALFTLEPTDQSSETWKIISRIEERIERSFPRDQIQRLRCLLNNYSTSYQKLEEKLVSNENNLLKNFSLKANAKFVSCVDYRETLQLGIYDVSVILVNVFMTSLIILSTYRDVRRKNSRTPIDQRESSIIEIFSVVRNWNAFRKVRNNSDFIKSLEGIRVFTIVTVIVGHYSIAVAESCVTNTTFVEKLANYNIIYLGLFCVQLSFLLSGWLLATHICKYLSRNGEISIKYILKLILYRYVRFLPVLLFVQMLLWTKLAAWLGRSMPIFMVECFKACQRNWWSNLLLMDNILHTSKVCNPILWSLSCEFQLFVIALAIFYISSYLKVGTKKIIFASALLFSVKHASIIYYYDYGYSIPFSGTKLDLLRIFDEFSDTYQSISVNFGAYAVGLLFGIIYFENRNVNIEKNMKNNLVWFFMFLTIPSIAIYLATIRFSRLWNSIIGALLKPLYAGGVGIGMLGIEFGFGGTLKILIEHDVIQLLAKLTYCAYLTHAIVMFFLTYIIMPATYNVDLFLTVTNGVLNTILVYCLALYVHITIERPFSRITGMVFFQKSKKE